MKKIWLSCLTVLAMILLMASSNALAQVNLDNQTTTDNAIVKSSVANHQTYLPIITRAPQEPMLFSNGDFEQGSTNMD